jgi:hypothetical protein
MEGCKFLRIASYSKTSTSLQFQFTPNTLILSYFGPLLVCIIPVRSNLISESQRSSSEQSEKANLESWTIPRFKEECKSLFQRSVLPVHL